MDTDAPEQKVQLVLGISELREIAGIEDIRRQCHQQSLLELASHLPPLTHAVGELVSLVFDGVQGLL